MLSALTKGNVMHQQQSSPTNSKFVTVAAYAWIAVFCLIGVALLCLALATPGVDGYGEPGLMLIIIGALGILVLCPVDRNS